MPNDRNWRWLPALATIGISETQAAPIEGEIASNAAALLVMLVVRTTRIKTGFGVPNLTAIRECAKTDRSIVADGGMRAPGDLVKALAFGADFLMLGSMLAGSRPTPGESRSRLDESGREVKFKVYRGMASSEVQDDYHGGMAEWKTSEGVSTEVPYREDEDQIIADIIGGLRSGLTYGGASHIRELQRKLDYVLVTPAGRAEGLPHRIL